jgi:hypothetical protein
LKLVRKSLIIIHRYLGISLCLLFLMWFVSGIAMIYARALPSLTAESRLAHLPTLNPAQIRLTPAEALSKAEYPAPPTSATLLTILNRPAYRFGGFASVFADTGELLTMNAERAAEAARLFMNASEVRAAGTLTEVDQWTLGERRFLPLHKFTVDDAARTELYVSELTGEVVLLSTRGSRALAWIAAIPHWMYFKPLRTKPRAWRQVVLWTSGVATVSVLLGLILGIIQYRRNRPHIPYSGWMRWHYITGVVFGIFTLTWVFSGFLSMEPWYWASDGGIGAGITESFQGGELRLDRFPVAMPETANAKEVEFLGIQGDPYYRIETGTSGPLLVSANSLQVRNELFSTDSLLNRIAAVNPEVKILESKLLEDYDSYYYSFGRKAPLPVLRVKFDDPDSTWLYVDPRMSQIVGRAHRRERLQRWIYRGFHSLDFSFWYYKRPLWDIGMILLSIGGVVLSLIGVVIAWKRVFRAAARSLRSL